MEESKESKAAMEDRQIESKTESDMPHVYWPLGVAGLCFLLCIGLDLYGIDY